MIELKTQKFDVVLAPAGGAALDETKKGLLNMKIKFIPAAPPVDQKQQPEELKKESTPA